jgi:hypothetical protein
MSLGSGCVACCVAFDLGELCVGLVDEVFLFLSGYFKIG